MKYTNEKLVELYRETRDEKYLGQLIKANEGLLYKWATSYASSIPNTEVEDLVSEANFPLLKAIEDFNVEAGVQFSTFLKTYVKQYFNRIYQQATRQKRFNGMSEDSYERITDINKDGEGESLNLTVDCEDYDAVEFVRLLNELDLNDKEQVVVDVLMAGGSKGDVAKALSITPASTTWYLKKLREKFIRAGYAYSI